MTVASPSMAYMVNDFMSIVRKGRFLDAIQRFYSDDIVSIESYGTEHFPKEQQGIEAIKEKNRKWLEMNDIHHMEAIGPMMGENMFSVVYKFDVTCKINGRMQMEEMAWYTVENGKIVREQFFYAANN